MNASTILDLIASLLPGVLELIKVIVSAFGG